jgi:hypothetical protein
MNTLRKILFAVSVALLNLIQTVKAQEIKNNSSATIREKAYLTYSVIERQKKRSSTHNDGISFCERHCCFVQRL